MQFLAIIWNWLIKRKETINMTKEPTWKKQGFKSYHEYREHLAKQKGFKSLREYQEHLARQKGFKSISEYKEHLKQKEACKFLQKKVNENLDPDSLFAKANVEFLRNITGCEIPLEKKKKEKKK